MKSNTINKDSLRTVSSLIRNIDVRKIIGKTDTRIEKICFDSRECSALSLFVAVRGVGSDGHSFIESAIANGAVAIVCDRIPECQAEGVTYVVASDSSEALAGIAANFYNNPSTSLKLVGITGTNGKTTTATLLYDLFTSMGYKCGLISTITYRIAGKDYTSTHTTPDILRLNSMLSEMAAAGCEYCFMEVSSHSIVQKRIAGLHFTGAIFTNITHDHLDYHKTFAEYLKAKKTFFDNLPSSSFALVNIDDRNGRVMIQNTSASTYTYSLRSAADFRCKVIEMHLNGMLLNIAGMETWVNLSGRFNAYNILCVYGVAILLGAQQDETLKYISSLNSVAGRFDYVTSCDGVTGIVDYAHTPDALQNVIDTINEIRPDGSRLIVLVGCGGDRDTAKRPVMARIATENSHIAIITSDNPRTEDPAEIIDQMLKGASGQAKVLTITDRREAIRTAALIANPKDTILVAGKGHETYQDIMGVKSHFSDKEELTAAFEKRI